LQLRETLAGGYFGDEGSFVLSPVGNQRPRLHPHSPTLRSRLWYGGGSLRSAHRAGSNGFHLLIGNLNQGEESDDFFETQQRQIEIFRRAWSGVEAPRIALGRVVVPTDSADEAARARHAAFANSRIARTLAPQGERRILFARDLVGPSQDILEALRRDPILPEVEELRLELPYDLTLPQYRQILTDFVERIASEISWRA
jgi:alkanesulfonate monooxygenase SsuD/methylene tetrahydromethanopterin reductase-like flavin-dependent oxidoreductase (luciferase family)